MTQTDQILTIDGKEYKASDLTDALKQELVSLRATDIEIARTEALLAMLKTARAAYGRVIKEGLDKV